MEVVCMDIVSEKECRMIVNRFLDKILSDSKDVGEVFELVKRIDEEVSNTIADTHIELETDLGDCPPGYESCTLHAYLYPDVIEIHSSEVLRVVGLDAPKIYTREKTVKTLLVKIYP